MTERARDGQGQRTVDEERAYIEGLLNTRFNYYLLFVPLLFVPVSGENALSNYARAGILFFGAIVSALMAYMVIRTKLLLDALLKTIVDGREKHPYKLACEAVERDKPRYSRNANDLMVGLVFIVIAAFVVGGVIAAKYPEMLFKSEAAATPAQTPQTTQTPQPAPAKPIPPTG
ncbi:MAG TPA: hypothetical protein VK614_02395 [Allosphingosinicella sp.]|nr:hypothetical protein [Allosphingosinicella sp.]